VSGTPLAGERGPWKSSRAPSLGPPAGAGALGRMCGRHPPLPRAIGPPGSASMGPPGRGKKGRRSRHLPGASLWGCAAWPAGSPEAGEEGRSCTPSADRTAAAGPRAQSSYGRMDAWGVSDVRLSLSPQAGRHASPGGDPPSTGRRGPRARWLGAPCTAAHAPPRAAVQRAASPDAYWPQSRRACGQRAPPASQDARHRTPL